MSSLSSGHPRHFALLIGRQKPPCRRTTWTDAGPPAAAHSANNSEFNAVNVTYFSTSVCTQPFQEAICRARSAIAKASWKGRENTAQSGDRQNPPKRAGDPPHVHGRAPRHAQSLWKGAARVVSAPYALLLPNLATGSPKISKTLLIGCSRHSRAGPLAPPEAPHAVVPSREQSPTPPVPSHTSDPIFPSYRKSFQAFEGRRCAASSLHLEFCQRHQLNQGLRYWKKSELRIIVPIICGAAPPNGSA